MKILSLALVSVGSLAAVAATPVPQVKVQVWKDAGMRGASAIISSKIGECIHLDRVAWEDTVSSIKVDSPFWCRVYDNRDCGQAQGGSYWDFHGVSDHMTPDINDKFSSYQCYLDMKCIQGC